MVRRHGGRWWPFRVGRETAKNTACKAHIGTSRMRLAARHYGATRCRKWVDLTYDGPYLLYMPITTSFRRAPHAFMAVIVPVGPCFWAANICNAIRRLAPARSGHMRPLRSAPMGYSSRPVRVGHQQAQERHGSPPYQPLVAIWSRARNGQKYGLQSTYWHIAHAARGTSLRRHAVS